MNPTTTTPESLLPPSTTLLLEEDAHGQAKSTPRRCLAMVPDGCSGDRSDGAQPHVKAAGRPEGVLRFHSE